VTAWSGVYFATLTLDGDVVPLLAEVSWLWRDGVTYPVLNDGFLVPGAYYLTGL
jgi:hypothetical protein